MRKVVITGMGTVCPVGNCVEDAWRAIKNGQSGIEKITQFDFSDYAVQIAAEVKDFNLANWGIEKRIARKTARFSQFLLAASIEAVNNAGYTKESLAKEKAGVIVGNCIGGIDAVEAAYQKYFDPQRGPTFIPPLTTPLMIMNEAAANVSMFYALHGPSWTVATACASGTDALGLSLDAIRSGRADVLLSGGTEAVINGFSIASYSLLHALSSHYNDTPHKACRPFDKDRDGFVVGEGAAVFVLEAEEHALQRGAPILAELAGFGSSCDAYHIVAPLPDGSGAALAVKEALSDAKISLEQVDYYNAHGTATGVNDVAETNMLKAVFGSRASSLCISSTKSMTGHLIGAAGALEALFCVKAIQDNFIPPTINLEHPDVEGGCTLDYTPLTGHTHTVNVAASASLGFGGHNSCIVLKKYNGKRLFNNFARR